MVRYLGILIHYLHLCTVFGSLVWASVSVHHRCKHNHGAAKRKLDVLQPQEKRTIVPKVSHFGELGKA